MKITPAARKWVQAGLTLAILVAVVRLALVYRDRHEEPPAVKKVVPLNPEAYVAPRKLYAYDLKSARQIMNQPVWVKEGYKYVYYPFDPVQRRSDFTHEAGRLGPIERLQIKDVVVDRSPGSPDQRQVMCVFEKLGKSYAFPVGAERHGDYQIYLDEILFIQDPHELYSFWPSDVWQAIERHDVKAGMDELQVSFALGVGLFEVGRRTDARILRYPNAGNPVVVTFRNGKAVNISHPNSPLEQT